MEKRLKVYKFGRLYRLTILMHINVEPKKPMPIVKKKTLAESYWFLIPIVLLIGALFYVITSGQIEFSYEKILAGINYKFFIFFGVGVVAQMVDGTMGMGYGATANVFLLNLGIPPKISSSAIHFSEMFTTGASAISHHRFGNINKKLFQYLLLPGVLGAATGAYILSDLIDGDKILPYVTIYTIILGVLILKKAFKTNITKKKTKNLGFLAIFGGFMDSVGGGGWGPIVTSTLLSRGRDVRYTIGSVNAAEFAVAFASGITFMLFDGFNNWQVASGLILGGICAAPFGAYFLGKIPRKPAQITVGAVIILLGLNKLVRIFL